LTLLGFWWFMLGMTAFVGGCIGSFLNVVAWRLPAGQSVVSPPSACPSCKASIRPRDNIPVLSWLILRGRCRDCSDLIAGRYPLVEALSAGIWAGVYIHLVPGPQTLLRLEVFGLVGVYGSPLRSLAQPPGLE
jgi:leader peptidase (prepilin peptidase)/N-methyltransferase